MKPLKKTLIPLILALVLCLSVIPARAAWYDAGAQFAEEHGLLEGTGHSFEPNAAAERALLVTALWKLDGEKAAADTEAFTDVEAGAWYAGAAGWARANGIVTGYSDGRFGALDTLTREQFAAMLYRYAGYLGLDASVGEDTNILSFTDALDWSEYAEASLQWAVGAGILQGTDGGRLDARGTLTQAQTFTMLESFDTAVRPAAEITGIIGAMDVEVASLKAAMEITSTKTVAGMEFCEGTLDGKAVVVVQCGMGKVNAGICAHTLINDFGVTRVINTGVAGSLDNAIDIGDIVVSTDAVQHDYDVTPIGFARGEIPYTGLYAFPADEALRVLAVRAATEAVPEIKVFEGRVCSGDQFIASREQKETIIRNFGGKCCEMEGGAIAQACYLNGTPFVIIRAISDKADDSEAVSFQEFEAAAAARCAAIVRYMITNY